MLFWGFSLFLSVSLCFSLYLWYLFRPPFLKSRTEFTGLGDLTQAFWFRLLSLLSDSDATYFPIKTVIYFVFSTM